MIDIRIELINENKVEITDVSTGLIFDVNTEQINLAKSVPENLSECGVMNCLERVHRSFDQDLNWLIIKRLSESRVSNRIIEEIPIVSFSADKIVRALLRHFSSRTKGIRVVCSPETYALLRAEICKDYSLWGSFCYSNKIMSVPIITENIPINEIWLIDLDSWVVMTTQPHDSVEFDAKTKAYIYYRTFNMTKPVCIGDKLIRLQILAEDPQEREMREIMDRMRLPARGITKEKKATPTEIVVPSGECVWLSGNPEQDLRVTKESPIKPNKVLPQMFNPGIPLDPIKLKMKKNR